MCIKLIYYFDGDAKSPALARFSELFTVRAIGLDVVHTLMQSKD